MKKHGLSLFFHFRMNPVKNIIENALKMLGKPQNLCCWYAINNDYDIIPQTDINKSRNKMPIPGRQHSVT